MWNRQVINVGRVKIEPLYVRQYLRNTNFIIISIYNWACIFLPIFSPKNPTRQVISQFGLRKDCNSGGTWRIFVKAVASPKIRQDRYPNPSSDLYPIGLLWTVVGCLSPMWWRPKAVITLRIERSDALGPPRMGRAVRSVDHILSDYVTSERASTPLLPTTHFRMAVRRRIEHVLFFRPSWRYLLRCFTLFFRIEADPSFFQVLY